MVMVVVVVVMVMVMVVLTGRRPCHRDGIERAGANGDHHGPSRKEAHACQGYRNLAETRLRPRQCNTQLNGV